MLFILILAAIIFLSIALVFELPQFGKAPSGERLERIKKSPNYKEKSFKNLNHTPDLTEGVSYWKILKEYIYPKSKDKKPGFVLPSLKTDLKNLPLDESTIVWFGHSSYFMQINDLKILVDPVFSGHASPFSFMVKSYDGANLYRVEDFPEIDILLISHDHFDHLDYRTIVELRTKVKKVITSLGVGSHLEYWGYNPSIITELDWYQQAQVDGSTSITATPARHFSGRTFVRNQTLWSSFVLKTNGQNIYVGGDSGYDEHFKEIGNKYGPFDLAILECGQYHEYWKYIHMMPEEVSQASADLKAKVLFPVHWSKFVLALHDWNEPIERLVSDCEKKNIQLITPLIGEKITLGAYKPVHKWWK